MRSEHGKYTSRRTEYNVFLYVCFAVFVVLVLFPFYWTAKSSISTTDQLAKVPPVYFPSPTLDNYRELLKQVPLSLFMNSFLFSIGSTVTTVVVGFLAAYAFARIPFPGSGVILWVFVLSMVLPEIAVIIPLFQMLGSLHLLDSLVGLIFVMSSALAPFTVWVFIPFIRQVPIDIEEAATIDGAGLFHVLTRVYLPVCAPALVTMLVINFVNAWNNLIYPLAFSSVNAKCLSVKITEVHMNISAAAWGRPWHLVSALGMMMVIPVIVMILCAQKAIVRGLTSGAVK